MVFTNHQDYLCYIEAVSLMYEENMLKHCPFVDDPNVLQANQYQFSKLNSTFLSETKRASEIFIVVDNTEWPEALKDKSWIKPLPYSEATDKTVFLEIHTNIYFTSTTRH